MFLFLKDHDNKIGCCYNYNIILNYYSGIILISPGAAAPLPPPPGHPKIPALLHPWPSSDQLSVECAAVHQQHLATPLPSITMLPVNTAAEGPEWQLLPWQLMPSNGRNTHPSSARSILISRTQICHLLGNGKQKIIRSECVQIQRDAHS